MNSIISIGVHQPAYIGSEGWSSLGVRIFRGPGFHGETGYRSVHELGFGRAALHGAPRPLQHAEKEPL